MILTSISDRSRRWITRSLSSYLPATGRNIRYEENLSWPQRLVIWAYPQETIETEDFTCEPILSTDEGVAFLVKTADETIYHAGDLNWWHWNGDPDEQNLEREKNFKREIDRMKGIHIDATFVPLAPRQEDAYRFCMDYCMEMLDADHVFPMHFWKNYDLCHAYSRSIQESHPAWYQRFIPISHAGQQFDI